LDTTTNGRWPLLKGERQVAPRIEDISPDHKYRYKWVGAKLALDDIVLDALCGVGYGSYIMAEYSPRHIYGFDNCQEAIDYGNIFFRRPNLRLICEDYIDIPLTDSYFSKVVCFEAIEHVEQPGILLSTLRRTLKPDGILYISSPNESITPYSKEDFPFHLRHWTASEFKELLKINGFKVISWYSQRDKVSKHMDNHPFGRTMIAEAVKV